MPRVEDSRATEAASTTVRTRLRHERLERSSSTDSGGSRHGKGVFERKKPHVNVGTIGHIDHGKTTLTAALAARSQAKFGTTAKNYKDIAKGGTERDATKTVTISAAHVEYESAAAALRPRRLPGPRRLHQEHDHRRRPDGRRDPGRRRAADGPMPQTREHILLARQVGVPKIVVFLNKIDLVDDPELLDLVEMEVRELLTKYGFPGDDTPIIRGSSQAGLGQPDRRRRPASRSTSWSRRWTSYIPIPQREIDKPFLMPIEDVFCIKGRGTVGTGRIERGTCKVGDTVEIVGLKPNKTTVVTGIEAFNKTLDSGMAGENVGVLLRGVEKDDLERGQVLCAPKSITPHTKFEAEVYVLTKEEGGRHTPFFTGYRPQFYFRTTDVTGAAKLLGGAEMVMPGDNVTMEVELQAPIAMEEKLRFAVREGGKTVGSGVVTKILA